MVVGIMSMSAGAAQGATLSWLILNSTHTTATELVAKLAGEKDSTHITLDGEIANLPAVVTCTNFALSGVELAANGKLNETGKVVFTGCGVYKTAPLGEQYTKCTVKTTGAAAGTVETNSGKGELVLVGTQLLTKIEPIGGPTGNFVTLRFEGAECTLTELNQVHGTLFLKDCQGFATTHKLKHLVEDAGASTALYVGGHTAKKLENTKLLGSGWIFLTGAHVGLEWSGMDV
jgi:hypothetical protein